ncbi:HNH endonuclease signature motif containing protein [Aeromicrobium sp. YIM 150415]|uniref:HNH endonuclease signature motif containing protein n=1 Tax=Aeromicrobium sp. YIM 150415 TaxID=2803912 RepID=UPI0035ABD349
MADVRSRAATDHRAWSRRTRGIAATECEAHHVRPWADGGPTSIDNGVLLCAHHHHKIHHTRWRVVINPRDRLPDFYPPGSDVPIRNTRYQPLIA